MKVRLELAPGADVKVIEVDGKPVALEFTPAFLSAKGTAVLFHGESTTNEGERIEKFQLYLSATSGKLGKRIQTGKVVALIDRPKEKTPPPPPQTVPSPNALGDPPTHLSGSKRPPGKS